MLVSGIDPATVDSALHFHWKAGSEAALQVIGNDGAIITKRFAEEHHLGIGERFRMTTPSGKRLDLRVAGIDARPEFNPLELADVSIVARLFDRSFEVRDDRLVFVKLDSGAGAARRARSSGRSPRTPARSSGRARSSRSSTKAGSTA